MAQVRDTIDELQVREPDAAFLAELSDALDRIVAGDLKVRLPRRGGLAGEVVDRINDLAGTQQRGINDILRISRIVGREGRMTERLDEEGTEGAWVERVRAVNSLIDDLARPTTEIARVIVAVADGDLSQHLPLEIDGRPLRGEFRTIGRTVNTMVDQLSSFADEVTRVAREVGTEGKLGGQAQVRGVAGTWRDLTDNVNFMASNLTAQVRNIAQVATAVAEGDLSQKITVDAQGEILALKSTVNTMVDQLSSFADEVTRVAREVGTDGNLGGQARVRGVSGTWRDLTENVNQLASTLTTQLRAIARVSTAVTRGDLTQRIAVDAQGEVAELTDNINQMIVTLRETTKKNAEQGWLDSNLARIGGLLQGQRDLGEVCRMIMSEVTPLVDAQLGAFFLTGADQEGARRIRLTGSYGYVASTAIISFAPGEGLVGQAAVSRQPIRVRHDPGDGRITIRSGIAETAPCDLVVVPVLFEGEPLGVIEFASVTPFSDLHLAFIGRLVVTIGVALKTILAIRRAEELLAQSQRLALELQDQSAELQRTNAELEEKATLLSDQKGNIEKQNREIEMARLGLEEKAQQLAQASQYKSEFLTNMSHELRTPLNSMLLLSRLLADDPDGDLTAKQVEFAQTIHGAGADLLALIDDILDLSKIEAGRMDVEPGEVSFDEIRAYVEQAFAPQAEEKGLAFEVVIDQALPRLIVTDPQRVRQILLNLLSNAVKFTDFGSVTLSIGLARGAGASAGTDVDVDVDVDTGAGAGADGSAGAPQPDEVVFSVIDTGIGISSTKLAPIFEAFQQADGTTSRKYGGTGLGLSISRSLALLLGGTIDVVSAVGGGSTFTLHLPFTRASEPDGTPQAGTWPVGGAWPVGGSWPVGGAWSAQAPAPAVAAPYPGVGPFPLAAVPPPRRHPQVDRRAGDRFGAGERWGGVEPAGRRRALGGRAPQRISPGRRQRRRGADSGGGAPLGWRGDRVIGRAVRNVFALTSALEMHGMTVLYADNGADGVRLLAERPEIDIVLMDAMMPGQDGNETTMTIRRNRRFADLPVVFLTAKAMPGDRESSFAAGASDYLTKPVDLDELLAVMAAWVNGEGRVV
jgi:signal transduction histidine kinase/CheY-like chemotaxis protein/HAMP domain-containing protein